MTDVFISYKRRLRPKVEQIAEALRALKLTVWFDVRLEPGMSFDSVIAEEVRSAACVLVCWSDDAFRHGGDTGRWVLSEAKIGLDREVAVPVYLEPATLDPPWNAIHTENLIDWSPDEVESEVAISWRNVVAAIGNHVGRPGLGDYIGASAAGTAAGLRSWVAANPIDPLLDDAWARIRELDAHPPIDTGRAPVRALVTPAEPSTGLWNLAAAIERVAAKAQEVNVLVLTCLASFLLVFLSYMVGLHDVEYQGRQVGFLWAPNWSVMYVVLFTAYNTLFCGIVNRVRNLLNTFLEARIISAPEGRFLDPARLASSWRQHLGGVSLILWVLVAVTIAISYGQWYKDCYAIVSRPGPFPGPYDWGTVSKVLPDISAWTEEWFSAIAYSYMAFALWIYFAVLMYGPTFAWYLRKLSLPDSDFRIVPHGDVFQRELQDVVRRVFICTFLGFLAAYLMRLQSGYRISSEPNVLEYMFSAGRDLFGAGLSRAAAQTSAGPIVPASAWTSLGVAIVALAAFVGTLILLAEAYSNSKEYYLTRVQRESWRRRAGVQLDEAELAALRAESFLTAIVPNIRAYTVMSLLLVSGIIWPRFGYLPVLAIIYGVGLGLAGGRRRPVELVPAQ